MPAYVVTQIEVLDPVRYEEYKKMSSSSVEKFGGRFIVRGGTVETLEGTWSPRRFVVVEFPSAQRAKEWWNSAEYTPGKQLRQETARTEMILVEGA